VQAKNVIVYRDNKRHLFLNIADVSEMKRSISNSSTVSNVKN
jgi:hypothetical protein